ncbi:probable N-acetylgalactosaminyltransferase 8 isoform X1 [Haliotis rufescens]|uniref:probable N-acetylgalactosaminyltransferase 8 isoform X1 n=2 Tax=Haliotis rufescens TaxID=6454 RepID=UPI001EAFA272|nr:probable N-acetylgalactosaminyltransferase 8 isoform X1 [Haliotis rufescens]
MPSEEDTMAKSGCWGLSFLKRTCRGCRRHLLAWLVGIVLLYSIFFVSQYVVLNNSTVKSLRAYDVISRDSDVIPKAYSRSYEPPTWGNVSGLRDEIKPLLIQYTLSLKKRGSTEVLNVPWNGPEIDFQSDACGNVKTIKTTSKATIIINLHGARVDKALTSLFHVIKLTNISLVEDVIIIGDMGLPLLYRDVYELFSDYLPTFRLFISPKRTTVTQARKYAAKFAHGEIIVFLDGLVVVTKHWLEQIMTAILENPNSIVQPLIITNQTILDKNGRPMYIHKREIQLDLTLKEVKVPVSMAENSWSKESLISSTAFALRKELYENLREFDEYSGLTDLETMVLSLKSWMCGEGVVTAQCATVILQSPTSAVDKSPATSSAMTGKTTLLKRYRHLLFVAAVWLPPYDEVYKCLLPKSKQVRLTYIDKRNIRMYKLFYNRLKCRKFTDFIKLVQPNFIKPERNTTGHGALSVEGHDLYLTRSRNGSLTFLSDLAPSSHPFTYANSKLTVSGLCVTFQPNNKIFLRNCEKKNLNQDWLYKDGQIRLMRNTHLCIVRDRNATIPSVYPCRSKHVVAKFTFTFNFAVNCIK